MKKKLILTNLFGVFFLISGCDFEENAMSRPLMLEIKEKNICLFSNSERSFLGNLGHFLIYSGGSDGIQPNVFEKKILIKEQPFPFSKDSCVLIPINLFELNKPYDFIIETGKSFSVRACIIRQGDGYRVKEVVSTENCDS